MFASWSKQLAVKSGIIYNQISSSLFVFKAVNLLAKIVKKN